MFRSKTQRNSQSRFHCPFVLSVEAQTIQRDRLRGAGIKCLREKASSSGEKACLIFTDHFTRREQARRIVSDIVATEIHPNFDVVLADNFREVVNDLVLRDIAPLRPVVEIATEVIERAAGEA